MSGDEKHEAEADDDDIEPELLQLLFDKSMDSWFARHTPTTTAMASGTKNEDQTAQKFASMSFVVSFFEVGLLKWDQSENIGVSPDGVALVNIPGSEHLNLEPHVTMVEIKTRVSKTTILKTENAREAMQAESVEGERH